MYVSVQYTKFMDCLRRVVWGLFRVVYGMFRICLRCLYIREYAIAVSGARFSPRSPSLTGWMDGQEDEKRAGQTRGFDPVTPTHALPEVGNPCASTWPRQDPIFKPTEQLVSCTVQLSHAAQEQNAYTP